MMFPFIVVVFVIVVSFVFVVICLFIIVIFVALWSQRSDTVLDDRDIPALQQLYQRITHLCLLHGENMEAVATAANKVLYQFSGLHFHGIFNKIILRWMKVGGAGWSGWVCLVGWSFRKKSYQWAFWQQQHLRLWDGGSWPLIFWPLDLYQKIVCLVSFLFVVVFCFCWAFSLLMI